jgi:HNH endonuclease
MAVAVADTLDIGSVASSIASVDVAALHDDEHARLVLEAEQLLNAVHCMSAVALEEFERRGTWADDGACRPLGGPRAAPGTSARGLRARARVGAGIRRHCTVPGCDRPPPCCDVHHCSPWSKGGTTSIDNGALSCRRHHIFIHKRGWTITFEDGKPVTRRSDGSEHRLSRWDTTGSNAPRRKTGSMTSHDEECTRQASAQAVG